MRKQLILACFLVGAVAVAMLAAGCSDAQEPLTPTYKTNLDKKEIRNSAFQTQFPKQYKTYEGNNETTVMTEYKGSVPFRKNDNKNELPKGYKHAQPYLKNLWLGYPFSFEYNEARGHTYAIHDILEIDRIDRYSEGGGLPATCWNCKTPAIPKWVEQHGDDKFWSMPFNKFRTKDQIDPKDHVIGCANCHNPETMELVITSFPLAEALERQGKDWRKASRNEMRSLVCAQCHVEYYFQEAKHGINKKPVFPWDNGSEERPRGMDPDQVYEYYNSHGAETQKGFEDKFADWTHPVSKTPMIKVQHPEFETWYDGPHGAAGVACADCHMPYTRSEGKKKFSSHTWTSPLKSPDGITLTCGQCHADKSPEYLKERVVYTQKKTFENLLAAQALSVKAHEAVRLANEWTGERNPAYDKLVINAKEMVRKGQFYWDFLSAENSVGFHNPAKAMDLATKSMQYSQEAINYAMQATNHGIGKSLEGNITDLVPPILEWTREMQMKPENLQKHVWTKYLKPLPDVPRMWDGQNKLR